MAVAAVVKPRCEDLQVWESLVLEQGVKNHLLEYATSALLFTDKGVSKNIISWNRYVHRCQGVRSPLEEKLGIAPKLRLKLERN